MRAGVPGQADPGRLQFAHQPDSTQVSGYDHGRGGEASRQHGLSSAPAALFDVVGRLEEEPGIRLDPVGPQGAQVGLVAFADVELLEEAGKRHPGVAMGQERLRVVGGDRSEHREAEGAGDLL